MMQSHRGFILLPVILLLAVIGTIALMLNQKSVAALKQTAAVNELEQAKYVAEAGLIYTQIDLANNTSCLGYEVAGTTTFNGLVYETSVVPNNGSPVTLTVSVEQDGVMHQIMTRSMKMYQPVTELVLNPSADAYIDEGNDDSNHGDSSTLRIRNPLDEDYLRSLLQFDLSTLPMSASQISSVSLDIFLITEFTIDLILNGNIEELAIFSVDEEWIEDEVTWEERTDDDDWSNEGGSFNATEVARATVDESISTYYKWDLTELTKDWLNGVVDNYGVLLKNTEVNSNRFKFASGNNSISSIRPMLRIKYQCECGQTCS